MQFQSRYVRTADGVALHVREWGQGAHPCVLVHGFGDGGFVWDEIAPALAGTIRGCAIDLRGHGESQWDPDGRYDPEAHASDVAQVIGELVPDRFVLIGHSMGGNIAIRVASTHPARVSALVIVDFAPSLGAAGLEKMRMEFGEAHRHYATVAEYASWLAVRRPLAGPATLARYAECALKPDEADGFVLRRDPAMGQRQSENAEQKRLDLWPALGLISCPTLVVRGIGSAMLSRAVGGQMTQALGRGRLREIKAAGHAVMIDNPGALAAELRSFLDEVL